MSNLNQPALRERRIRWLDQEMDEGSRFTWDRNQLNEELFANEQRLFQQSHDDLIDLYPPIAPSPSLLDLLDSPSIPPPFDRPPSYMEQPNAPLQDPFADPPIFPGSFPQPEGYMEQPSAFVLDSPPTESTFLESFPKGNATLTYQNDDGELESIRGVNLYLVEQRSPILGMAFETGRSGPRLYLETLTSATAYPFLRYIYSGSYALRTPTGEPGDFYEDVPTSVLLHCQLYRLADIYDLPDLKSQAYVNVLRQCEFGCSSPDKPIDLCAAIRFVYDNLQEHENLIDAILNYCVSCFLQHRLAEDQEFKKLAYDLRPFHQALCRNSMGREFENETAAAIVQMPFKPYIPETYASREDAAATKFDHVFHFHATDRFDKAMKKRRRSDVKAEEKEDSVALPIRPRPGPSATAQWSLSFTNASLWDEDYTLGSKRRASSVSKEQVPIFGGISQLRAAESEAVVSESEYDIVNSPEAATMSHDSDSDSIEFVKVEREASPVRTTLVIRNPDPANMPAAKSAADEESDSEWMLL